MRSLKKIFSFPKNYKEKNSRCNKKHEWQKFKANFERK